MQQDIEGHPIKVGDKVVFNTGKHYSGVRIGIVVKLRGTTEVEIDTKRGGRYDVMKKAANHVYVIKS